MRVSYGVSIVSSKSELCCDHTVCDTSIIIPTPPPPPPPHNKVVGGYIGFTPSVIWPASCVRSVAPTVLDGSISYILSSKKVCCMWSFLQNFKIWIFSNLKKKYLDFVFFWLGIWCESLVSVIMGWWGVSQNTGVLVVLVLDCYKSPLFIFCHCWQSTFM